MGGLSYHDFLASFGIGGAHPGGFALTQEIVAQEQLKQTSIVLDVGCGTGQTAAYLARTYGCDVTALDRHPLMIEKARRRFAREKLNVRLEQGEAERLPFTDRTFDLVLSESVTIFTNLSTTLVEYARVLKRGGILLLVEMTAERPLSAKELGELRGVYGTRQVPTEAEWCGRLNGAGFNTVQVIKGGTVASALEVAQSHQMIPPEMDPSDTIDPKLHEIGAMHQDLTERYSRRLGYRVYRARIK